MILDLHIHTKILSSDSELAPEEAIEEARKQGLDGICFTEHNRSWNPETLRKLGEKERFLTLSGVEVDSTEGHILVYGVQKDFETTVPIEELRREVDKAGGIMIAAHPFRGFAAINIPQLQMTPEQGAKKHVFRMVDGIETYNGRLSDGENRLAEEVKRRLNLKEVGGSDAHTRREVGRCVTIFENDIFSERDLLRELKKGAIKADYFRKRSF